ncbi:MAG: molybdopterin-dependent oxidoreductase [Deltaproteobacteria bacterium]|nr:molybdopterin-dependent oxidoreductase [Deltaproteobacteria bacterium]
MSGLTRRQFIQIGGAAAGTAAVGAGLTTNWFGADPDVVHDPGTEGDRVVPTFCELCFWKCGVLAHVKDGRVTKLTGNPAHPLSRGRLCPRGTGGIGLLYDPDRLKKPLIRKSKGGDQVFREVEWDAALDHVAENLLKIKDKYGPEAMALYSHGYGGSWFKHLLKAYGSGNIAAPSYAQCRGPREVGFQLTFGSGVGSPETTDMEHSRVITLIGSHLGENMHNTQVQDLARALDRGAELVVVDPRFSIAAGKARYWLPIKPGTDIALLLAWMHVIVNEGLYDHDYLARYAVGLDKLKESLKDRTPEWAFARTTIPPETIVETARFIAGAGPASLVHPGRHVTWYGDDTQRSRAIALLNALLGAWGRKGGFTLPSKVDLPSYPYTKYAHKPKAPPDMPKDTLYPLADSTLASGLCMASIPGTAAYDIKGWIVYGTNLIQSLPAPEQTMKAIQSLDFMVAVDVLPAEICGFADVVLPESTYLERCDEVHTPPYKEPFVAVRQPVVDPLYDSKPGWWIARELAHRIGLNDYFPWKDSVEYAMHRVKAGGFDCDELRLSGVALGKPTPVYIEDGLDPAFDTPSGKIELYSDTLEQAGFDPVPQYEPPEEPPPGQFRLLFGRSPAHTFGRTTNNRFLSEVVDGNEVWLNARVATEMGLKDGTNVVLINQDGVRSEPVPLKATQRIRPDCVYMVHGYGHDAKGLKFAKGRGASDSRLVTRYKVDPIMGGTGMNVNFVRVERWAS